MEIFNIANFFVISKNLDTNNVKAIGWAINMVIDFHTHLGFNSSVDNATKLVASLRRASINKALVFAGDDCSTSKLLKEVEPFKSILMPIGSVSPLCDKKSALCQIEEWLDSDSIHGLKFYPGYEYYYPFDEIVRPYLNLLQKYNKLAIFHSGDTHKLEKKAKLKFAHPLHLDDVAVEFPELKIVIAHLGYPWVIDTAQVMSKNDNIYADCSGLLYDKPRSIDYALLKRIFSDFLEYGGKIEKVFFGSDWSVADQKAYLSFISSLKISDHQKKGIFYRNLADLIL
jgi:hypothetical protein